MSFCSSVSMRTISRDKLRTWFLSERPSPFSSRASSSPSTYQSQRQTPLSSCQAHVTAQTIYPLGFEGQEKPLQSHLTMNLTQVFLLSALFWGILDLKSYTRPQVPPVLFRLGMKGSQFCFWPAQPSTSRALLTPTPLFPKEYLILEVF